MSTALLQGIRSVSCPMPPSSPSLRLEWKARWKHLAYNECWVLFPPWVLGGTPAFGR